MAVTQLISKSGNAEQQRSAYKLYTTPRAGLAVTANTWASLVAGTTTTRIRVLWVVASALAVTILNLNEGSGAADGTAANDFWGTYIGAGLSVYMQPFGNGILLGTNNALGINSSATTTVAMSVWGFIEGATGPTS